MSAFKSIHTVDAPKAIGPYSQATQVGNFIFLSGQIGLDPSTTELVKGGCEAQLKQVFNNMQAVAAAAGASFNEIVKLTIYLKDLNDFAIVNEMMKEQFQEPYPARTTIQVAALPKGALVELDAIIISSEF
jgi:reactive intermediate/imine deaminase